MRREAHAMQSEELPPTYVEGFHDRAAVNKMKYTRLGNTDMIVSSLGYGASGLGLCYEDYDYEAAKSALTLALKSGVNYIDTAPWYGQGRSEETLGKMLQDVPRKAYYLATKVGRYERDYPHMFDFSAERVAKSVPQSLRLLRVSEVDLIQIHDLEFCPVRSTILEETLPAVAALRRSGLTRHIGVTGYSLPALLDVVRRSSVHIDTVLSYSRNNLHDTALQRHLPELKQKGLGVIDAAATNMGLFSPAGPPDWHPATPEVLEVGTWARQLCEEQGVNIAHLAVNFMINQPGCATHLTSMMTSEFVRMNLAEVGGKLTDQEQRISDQIRQRFASLGPHKCNWEGHAEKKYWDAMGFEHREVR